MEAPNYFLSSLLILGASSLCFLLYAIRNKKKGATGGSFSLTELLKNKDRILDWSTEVLSAAPNNTIAIDFLNTNVVLTTNPSNLEHVLKTNFQNYIKGPATIATFEDLLGHGILNSDGDHWHLQRKLVGQEFATKNFRHFAMDTVFSSLATRLVPLLSSSLNHTTDLQEIFERFSFDNFCKITFGIDPRRLTREQVDARQQDYEELLRSFESSARLVTKRYGQPKLFRKLASFLGLGVEKKLHGELAILNAFLIKVIKERRNGGFSTGSDLLSRLLTMGDFPDVFLRDMMINLMGAGRDTTASGMAWFFWLISSKPDVQSKIVEEIRSVREKNGTNAGDAFTLDEIREMNYLHAAVSESLRLYPPVPVDARVAVGPDVLPDGTKVSKGTSITHSAYVLGRIESIWGKDCKEFVPERFLDDNGLFQPKNPYQYVVFHAGPRMCPGKEMAYNQIKAVVASIMEKFVVEMAEEGEREQENVFALRMKRGLPVLIRAR